MPTDLMIADLDGDGFDDAVLLAPAAPQLWVSWGTADGIVDAPVPVAEGDTGFPLGAVHAANLAIEDFDQDGILDVVVLTKQYFSGFNLQYIRGAGNRAFDDPTDLGVTLQQSLEAKVQSARVDGDTIPDLILGPVAGVYSYRRGLGGGQFAAATSLVDTTDELYRLQVADFDGDGAHDAAMTTSRFVPGTGRIVNSYVAWGGSGLPFSLTGATPMEDDLWIECVGDLDGDGDLDLLARSFPGVQAVENLGGRAFAPKVAVPAASDEAAPMIADLNADGLADIFQVDNRLFYIPHLTPFTFGPRQDLDTENLVRAAVYVTPADSIPDLFVVELQQELPLFASLFGGVDASGSYAVATKEAVSVTIEEGTLAAIDADHDGDEDLVGYSVRSGSAHLVLLEAVGDGTFEKPALLLELAAGYLNGDSLSPPVVGDFDGNGFDDVAVFEPFTRNVKIFLGTQSGLGSGNLGLQAPFPIDTLQAADINADGYDDLIWTSAGGAYFAKGSTIGLGAPTQVPSFSSGILAVVPIDADLDGDLDLAIGDDGSLPFPGSLRLSLFDGHTYQLSTELFSNYYSESRDPLRVADLDGDGINDLVKVVLGSASRVGYYRGNGDETFEDIVLVGPDEMSEEALLLDDVDLDGDVDLIFRSDRDPIDRIEALLALGNGNGSFTASGDLVGLRPGDSARDYVLLDLDGDGDKDLAFISDTALLGTAINETLADIGTSYCGPAVANSTGSVATAAASGSASLSLSKLCLAASDVPQGSFGFFLAGQVQGNNPSVMNSVGRLCLADPIGRFSAPSEIQLAGPDGRYALTVDVTSVPSPALGLVSIQPGETWNFQAWYRDAIPALTSNFTTAVSVTFQ